MSDSPHRLALEGGAGFASRCLLADPWFLIILVIVLLRLGEDLPPGTSRLEVVATSFSCGFGNPFSGSLGGHSRGGLVVRREVGAVAVIT